MSMSGIYKNTLARYLFFRCCNASSLLFVYGTLIDTIYSMSNGAYQELTIKSADLLNFDSIREIARPETAEMIGNSILMGFYSNM